MKNLNYKISLAKAKKNKLFYFVATATVYRKRDGLCLILKRSQKEKAHPGLWCVPGGKLEHEDLFSEKPNRINYDIPNWQGMVEKLVSREVLEECGIHVTNVTHIDDVVFIRPDHVPVVCLKFASIYKSGKIKHAPEFDDYAWVNPKEIKNYKIIKGIDQEIEKTITLFKNL